MVQSCYLADTPFCPRRLAVGGLGVCVIVVSSAMKFSLLLLKLVQAMSNYCVVVFASAADRALGVRVFERRFTFEQGIQFPFHAMVESLRCLFGSSCVISFEMS